MNFPTLQIVDETQGHLIGTATYLMIFRPVAGGEIGYQVGSKDAQTLYLGHEREGCVAAGIIQPRLAAFYDPVRHTLLAAYVMSSRENLTILVGPRWGDVLDEHATELQTSDPCKLIRAMKNSLIVEDHPPALGLRYLLNVHAMDRFTPEVKRSIQAPDELNYIHIYSDARTGAFRNALLETISKATARIIQTIDLNDFPVRFPAAAVGANKAAGAGPADTKTAGAAGTRARTTARPQPTAAPRPTAAFRPPPPPPPLPPRPAPILPTTEFPVDRMAEAIAAEPDEERRWTMVEENLKLARPERTYFIITRFTELVAERIAGWPAARLLKTFGAQSGTVLEGVCRRLPVDRVLALSDENPERERVLDWLREREIERLLRLKIDGQLITKKRARELLFVSPRCGKPDVKKVWRTLLGFLNADYGRHQEKAIHQKKDTVAKKLQTARDILLKG